jgi:hypothetical protein
MAGGSGRISLLVSKDLQLVASVAANLEPELSKQLNAQTRQHAEPVWREEVRERASSRLQVRALSDTAKVSVTRQNVFLKSAGTGRLSSGVRASKVAAGAEYGAWSETRVKTRSRKQKSYERRMGDGFPRVRRGGHVIHQSVGAVVPRIASLWAQTAFRTVADLFEKAR